MGKSSILYFVNDGPDESHVFWESSQFGTLKEAREYIQTLAAGRWYRLERHDYSNVKPFAVSTPENVRTIEGPKEKKNDEEVGK